MKLMLSKVPFPEAATVTEILDKDFIQEGLPGDTGKGVLPGALAFSM